MTWQDELQHLDAELAAGRISAEEYRTRRDAALGRAQAGQSGTSSGGQQGGQPTTPSGGVPQQGQNPFPPAFTWSNAAAQSQQAGSQSDAGPDESTQVVANPLAGAQPPPDSSSTQVVNVNQQGGGQQAWPPPPTGWGPQQGWNTADSSGTPWGDSDLPPAPEHGDTSWMRQGPEVFETAGKSSKGKRVAGLSIGAVLLVGVVIAGVFYFTSGGEPNPPSADTSQQQPPPPPTKTLPEPPAAKPTPPGSSQEILVAAQGGPVHPFNGALDRFGLEGPKGGLLPPTVRDFALQNGAVDGWFNGTDATPRTTLIAIRMPDQDAASKLAKKYLDGQQGLATVDDLSYRGVEVVSTGSGTFRTAYVTHSWAVIVDVSGPAGQAAKDLFKSTLDQQLAQSPPTVRE